MAATSSQMLRLGSSGPGVIALREQLSRLGFGTSTTPEKPEVFDGDLHAALKKFQTYAGVAVDGIVGPATQNAINQAFAASMQKEAPKSSESNGALFIVGFSLLGIALWLSRKSKKPALSNFEDAQSDALLTEVKRIAERGDCKRAVPMYLRRRRVLPRTHLNSDAAKDADATLMRRCGDEISRKLEEDERDIDEDIEDALSVKRGAIRAMPGVSVRKSRRAESGFVQKTADEKEEAQIKAAKGADRRKRMEVARIRKKDGTTRSVLVKRRRK